jgi:2-polyprenyl-6-hydroxyphenyl methylase/3-demethylubiquinone-9 3-methyltransferase
MNTNHDEINKFTEKANEWWDPNGSFKMLHEIYPLRLIFILSSIALNHDIDLKSIDNTINNINILDVGCGGGILCESIAKNLINSKITGIDAGYENIQIAKEHCSQFDLNIDYINTSLENFESKKKFDVVVSLEVIEHCEDYKAFLEQLSNLLKPNGLLFLSTINRNLKSYFQAIIAAEYILKWVPKKTHEWKKFLKPSEINKVLEKENLKIKKIKGIKFDIITQSWYESNDIDVNYMLVAQKLDN